MKINRLILFSFFFFCFKMGSSQSNEWYYAMFNQSAKLVLDNISPVTASNAYSLRKLSVKYSGPCLKVQRSSDNAQLDINFSGNTVDTTSLKSFVGNATGWVAIWYDQSSNGRNLVQTDVNLMPIIVTATGINYQFGRPYLDFDNGRYFQTNSAANYLNSVNYTINLVSTMQSIDHGFMVSTNSTTTDQGLNFGWESSSSFLFGQENDDALFTATNVSGIPTIITGIKANGSGSVLYKYGVQISTSANPSNALNTNSVLNVGTDNTASNPFYGNMQELVIYASALDATRRSYIESNQFAYYQIPVAGTPSFLTATSGSSIGEVNLSWQAPIFDNGNSVSDYFVEYSVHGSGNWIPFIHDASTTTNLIVTGLDAAVNYDFRVSAVNTNGIGIASNIASAYPPNYFLITGSTYGLVNTSSPTFTITPAKAFTGTITITPSGCGLSAPIQFNFNNSATTQTFVLTPTSTGTVTLMANTSDANTINPQAFYYTSSGFTNAIQDQLSVQPGVVFSLRQTRNSFLSPAIKVYNVSNQSESLVTFDSTGLISERSVATITVPGSGAFRNGQTVFFSDFFAGASTYIKTWYDQSGNGNDVFQNVPDTMPLITNIGSINRENSNKPSLLLFGSWLQSNRVATYLNNGSYTLNALTSLASSKLSFNYILGTNSQANNKSLIFGFKTKTNFTIFQPNTNSPATASSDFVIPSNTSSPVLFTGIKNGASGSSLYRNGILVSTNANIPSNNLSTDALLNIGTGNDNTANNIQLFKGTIQEIFIFPAALSSADRTKLELNQNTFYQTVTVPGSPTNLTVTATSQSGQISFTWTAPVSNGGSAITDYTIEYKTSASANWVSFPHTASTATSIAVTGLSLATSYDFRVSAVNAIGASSSSAIVTTIINNAGFQIAGPGYLTLNNYASSPFTVTPLSPFTGDITVTASGQGISTTVLPFTFNNSAQAQSFIITPTIAGTISLQGVNNGGLVNPLITYSASSVFTNGVLDAVNTNAAAAFSLRQTRLSFNSPPIKVINRTNNAEATVAFDSSASISSRSIAKITSVGNSGYLIGQTMFFSDFYNNATVAIKTWYDQSGNGRDMQQNNTGLQPVLVTNGAMNMDPYNHLPALDFSGSYLSTSSSANFLNGGGYTLNTISTPFVTPFNAYLLGTPTTSLNQGLHFGWRGASTFTLAQYANDANFTTNPVLNTAAIYTGIKLSGTGSTLYKNGNLIGTDNSLPSSYLSTNSPLQIGTALSNGQYFSGNIQEVIVYPTTVNNAQQSSMESDQAQYYQIPYWPGSPTNLTATTGDVAGKINLSWTAPLFNGNTAISDYKIEYSITGSGVWSVFVHASSTATNAIITGLNNNTSYDFRVSAINGIGTGKVSATSTALTKDIFASYSISGSSYGLVNTASQNFTVTPTSAYTGTITITPNGGGLSTPIVLTFANSNAPQTFTITPTSAGTVVLSGTNNGGRSNPVDFFYTSASVSTPVADQVGSSSSVLYSLRQCRSSYLLPAIKVINTGNNAEANIGFDSTGIISGRSLATITVAGSSGYLVGQTIFFSNFYASSTVKVKVWYDQSGNNRDALQPILANQPVIVNSGILVREGQNQLPVLDFNGAFMQTTSAASYLNGAYTLNTISTPKLSNITAYLLGTNNINNTDQGLHFGWRTNSQFTIAQFGDDANFSTNFVSDIPTLFTGIKNNGSGSSLYKNGNLIGNNGLPTNNLNTSAILNIGTGYATNLNFSGYIQEIIAFSSALGNSDRNALESNQYAFYIPQAPGAPIGLTATPGNVARQINLAWAAPASNGNGIISDYQIEYSINGSGTWNTYNDGTSTNTNASLILPDGNYDFRVRAINVIGTGNPSAIASSNTPVYYSVSGPTYGNLTVATSPVFTVTPPVGYNGIVTVVATGAGLSATTNLDFTISNAAQNISFTPTTAGTLTLRFSNNKANIVDAPIYYYTTANPATTILDTLSTIPSIAYSVRQLKSTYKAGAVKVINISNNAEATVTFDSSGIISSRSIATITAVGTGSYINGQTILFSDFYANATVNVKTWYDQSGNGRDVLQGSSGTLPVLVSSGSIVQDPQSKWTVLDFNNAYMQTTGTATFLNNTGYTLNTVSTPKTGSYPSYMLGTLVQASNQGLHFGWRTSSLFTIAQWNHDANYNTNVINNMANVSTGIKYGATGSSLFKNGTIVGSQSFPNVNMNTAAVLSIGAGGTSSSLFNGYLQEVMIFDVALNATDQSKMDGNQYSYFVPQLPGAPTGLFATGGLPGQVNLSWTAPFANGNSAITDYLIEYSINGSGSWSTFTHVVSTATSSLIYGLTPGTAYLFRVSAVNGIGTGTASSIYNFVIPATYSISGPSYGLVNDQSGTYTVTPTAAFTGTITITPSGGGVTTPIQLFYNNSAVTQTFTFTPTSAGTISLTTSNNAGLADIGTIYYTVGLVTPQILDSLGATPSVAYSIRQLRSSYTSAAVKVINASNNAEASITFDSTGQISNRSVATITSTGNSSYFAGQSLIFSNFYSGATVRVKAWFDQSGNNRDALIVNGVTPPVLVSSGSIVQDPQNSRPVIDFNNSYLQTSAAATYLNNTGYTLNVVSTPRSSNSEAYLLGTTANIDNKGLHFGWRSSSAFTIAQHGNDANFTTNFISNISAIFTGIKTGVSGSSLYKNGTSIGSDASPNSNMTVNTPLNVGVGFNVSKLFNGYIQEVILFSSALNVVDQGKMETNQFDYFVPQLPNAPTGLLATAGNVGQISLNWSAPTKNGNSVITDYLIEYSINGSGSWSTFAHNASTATSTTINGLTSGTSYLFRISAVNGIGTGIASGNAFAIVN